MFVNFALVDKLFQILAIYPFHYDTVADRWVGNHSEVLTDAEMT